MKKKINTRIAWPMLVGFAVGASLSAAAFTFWPPDDSPAGEIHLGQQEFINPLLACPSSPKGLSPNKAQLLSRLETMIGDFERGGKVQEVSVLFRDLNGGASLGINQKEPFIAASLLKTPILMTFLKKAVTTPGFLNTKVKYDAAKHGRLERQATILSSHPPMQEGQFYSVEELLDRMIVDSDNMATSLLMSEFPGVETADTLRDMGIPVTMRGDELWINVEDYAFIFRILYNSTYLPPQLSNDALKLLTKVDFSKGLVAGVGKDYAIAHKFGEREIGNLQQFHDCGIVYFPLRPYLLCIMTRGNSQPNLIEAVASLSKAVFEQVKKDSEGH